MKKHAMCYSARCAKTPYSTKPVIKENVIYTDTHCKDYGHILVWFGQGGYLGARRAANKKREESKKEYLG